jgi:hypothetical protein
MRRMPRKKMKASRIQLWYVLTCKKEYSIIRISFYVVIMSIRTGSEEARGAGNAA